MCSSSDSSSPRRLPGDNTDIQPLTDSARASYAGQWTSIQEQFVDAPADAVSGAQLLVAAVMTERGYPAEHDDQVLADLSVEHSGTLDRYRAAEEISQRAVAGTALSPGAWVYRRPRCFYDLDGYPPALQRSSTLPLTVIFRLTRAASAGRAGLCAAGRPCQTRRWWT